MNKIEKYIRLCDKVHTMIEKQEFNKAFPFINEINEIAGSYRVEDLVSDFDSIGYKVDIKKLTERLLKAKKTYKENGRTFDDTAIGNILLMNFAKEYEKRRSK